MRKYLVLVTAVATKQNPNFAGEVRHYYYGKDQHLVASDGDHYIYNKMYPTEVEEFGYDTEASAKRSWVYNNTQNTDFWKSAVAIIPVEL